MSSTLQALRHKSASKVLEEKRQLDRKRELLALTLQFLQDQGYGGAAEQLQHEAGLSLGKLQVADNVDLSLVFQHYLEYYEMRYGRAPKIIRKQQPHEAAQALQTQQLKRGKVARRRRSSAGGGGGGGGEGKDDASEEREAGEESRDDHDVDEDNGLIAVEGRTIATKGGEGSGNNGDRDSREQRLLKPLSLFLNGTSSETKELALLISRDIFTDDPNVRWEDVIGLADAKRLLKEAVVMPMRYPELFKGGLVSPWKGALLFGPPGTGKTMLAKAVATECNTTFFNISASSIVSRYRGDSEKLVRILFDLARYHAPSTIFLDEIDSIMGQRGGSSGNEHEASRRMKTELLIQMDGLAKSEDSGVFVLAASNLPWQLDTALLRRLEKRVLVRLPQREGRLAVFRKHLPDGDQRTKDIDYDVLAEKTAGYSCADVCLVCKEAAMHPIRRLMEQVDATANPAALKMGPVTDQDAQRALHDTKPAATVHLEQAYAKWLAQFGST